MSSTFLKVVRSRTVTALRNSQTSTVTRQERIYNAPINKEVMKNWKPHDPCGPVYDGWPLKRWPFKAKSINGTFIKGCLYIWTGIWTPFFVIRYQLMKANSAK